jgi:hypothetical protein
VSAAAIDARAAAAWMRGNPGRREELLREQGADASSPAGDAAIAANLRFLAEGLAEAADGPLAEVLARFAANLPASLPARADHLEDALRRQDQLSVEEATRQFGPSVPEDPEFRATLARRARLAAWGEVFVACLADHLDEDGPLAEIAPRLEEAVALWMAARQDALASAIFAIDKRAKQAAIARGGPHAVDDPETVNSIGQAASVQGHTLFLAEALAAALSEEREQGAAAR